MHTMTGCVTWRGRRQSVDSVASLPAAHRSALIITITGVVTGGTRNFHLGVWGTAKPRWGSCGQSPPEVKAVCRHCLQISTSEMIKICKFCTIHLLVLDQCVSWWGLSDTFEGLAPTTHAWCHDLMRCYGFVMKILSAEVCCFGHFVFHTVMKRKTLKHCHEIGTGNF